MKIQFEADRVKVKTGHRVDNSGEITFMVGEYMLPKITPLTIIVDKILKVTVEIDDGK